MSEKPKHHIGAPIWSDCATTDLKGAEAFYASVFGWSATREADTKGAIYSVQRLNGKRAAGLYELTKELRDMGVPPHWATYFSVTDLEESLRKVSESGGVLLDGPIDEPGVGKMAVIQDPVGAYLRLWSPVEGQEGEVFNETGAMMWNELCTRDVDSAARFYKAVLNLDPKVIDAGGRPYTLLQADGHPVAGILEMTPEMSVEGSTWDVYVAADDVDDVVQRVKKAGGSVVAEPFDLPVGARMAVVKDPFGAVFEIMSTTRESA